MNKNFNFITRVHTNSTCKEIRYSHRAQYGWTRQHLDQFLIHLGNLKTTQWFPCKYRSRECNVLSISMGPFLALTFVQFSSPLGSGINGHFVKLSTSWSQLMKAGSERSQEASVGIGRHYFNWNWLHIEEYICMFILPLIYLHINRPEMNLRPLATQH